MTFYLTLPLLCRIIKNVNQAFQLLLSSLLLSVALEFLLHNTILHTNQYLFYYFPNQLPIFSLGILAFFVLKEPDFRLSLKTLLLVPVVIAIYHFTGIDVHFVLSLVFFATLIVLAKRNYKIIVNKSFSTVGKASFSMYLVHFAMLYWMTNLHWVNLIKVYNTNTALLNFLLRFAILSTLSFFLSWFTYQLVEVPFQKLGKRMIDKIAANNALAEKSPNLLLIPVKVIFGKKLKARTSTK